MTMRNDATRLQIDTKDRRRPRAVVSRQGQVLLDTDFDQQVRHGLDRVEIETRDVLGFPGRLVVPAGDDGFHVTPSGAPANFDIGQGHGYLDGWLLENVAPCKLGTQPHPRSGDVVGATTVILVKALVRHIDPVEETAYADVALGDAQASGRALNDWQVLPLGVTPPGTVLTCATVPTTPEWIALVAPSTGLLMFQKAAAAPSTDPCSLTPGGGYTRLENLLYRIEVHGGDIAAGYPTDDGARFNLHNLKLKLSRRNASMMVRISEIVGTELTVTPPALDPRNWFAPGLYAEIVSLHDDVDPRAATANERLFRVAKADDSRVTLEATSAQIAATGANALGDWFLRLWDSFPGTVAGGGSGGTATGIATVSAPGGAIDSAVIDLGDGLSIQLSGGASVIFRRGDYWTCAARADGSISWLDGGATPFHSPHGPTVHYGPLAVPSGSTFDDCRIPFATLTDKALLYRGGDGQCAFAPVAAVPTPVKLAGKLRVAVMRGQTPVAGVRVRWSLVAGSPDSQIGGTAVSAAISPETMTDAGGLAEVDWSIDASQQAVLHRVQAALLDAPPGTPPVVFSAMFESAALTSYLPGKCDNLLGVDNVQDALDTLCAKIGNNKFKTMTLQSILLVDQQKNEIELIKEKLILNGLEVPMVAFTSGIVFGLDSLPDIDPKDFDPIAEIELDLPYPTTDPDKLYWTTAVMPKPPVGPVIALPPPPPPLTGPFGFQRVRLDGTVNVVDKGPSGLPGLSWTPSAMALLFLERMAQHLAGQTMAPDFIDRLKKGGWRPTPTYQRLLCRIRLRAPLIWSVDPKTKARVYLNAEHLGVNAGQTRRELLQGDRDPQRAADLDIFIYLLINRKGIRKRVAPKSPVRPRRGPVVRPNG